MLDSLRKVRDRLAWMLAIAMALALMAPVAALAAPFVEDSYTGPSSSGNGTFGGAGGGVPVEGQSFTASEDGTLDSAMFHLSRSFGTVTGNAYALLYAHSGTYGTSSLPTGDPLATSDPVDVGALSLPDYFTYRDTPVTFHFDNTYTLTAGTHYVIAIKYEGGTFNGPWLTVAVYTVSSAHAGNFSFNDLINGVGWTTSPNDAVFAVYANSLRAETSITAPAYTPPTRLLRKTATVEATVTPAAAAVASGEGYTLCIYKKHVDRKTKVVTWPLYTTASMTGDPATGRLTATLSALRRGEYHLVVDFAGSTAYLPSTSPEGTFTK